MANGEKKSYRREDVRARTSGEGVQIAGAEEAAQRGQAAATQWQQAIDAGYDPVSYGYNPNTGQKVGETNARRQVAEAEAAKKKAEIEQEEANKRAMVNAGLTEDGKARAPKGGQTATATATAAPRAATPAPRKSFTVGEDGKPEWTGGYIDGRIGGEVMREERAKAEAAFKQGKGPQPFGPSKSDREYDAYLEAMNKYNASQKPTTPTDPTTDLDGVDDSATPKPPTSPTPPTTPTAPAAPTTDTAPAGGDMASGSTAAVQPAVRSPEGDAARFFNTIAKGVSAGGKAGSFKLTKPTTPQGGLAGAANRFIQGNAAAMKNLPAISSAADDVIKAQRLVTAAQLGVPNTPSLYRTGVKLGAAENTLNKLLQPSGQTLADFPDPKAIKLQAADELAQATARSKSLTGKAANVFSKAAKSPVLKGAGKGFTVAGAAMDIFDSATAVGSALEGGEYDYNNAEAAAYRDKIEKFGEAGALGKAGMLAAETYNLTPAVIGGGGNTVSGLKAMQDVAIGAELEAKGSEGDIQSSNLKTKLIQRQAKGEQDYREALLLPAGFENATPQEKSKEMAKALKAMKPADRTRVLDEARTNMFVDRMLEGNPALKQSLDAAEGPEKEAIIAAMRDKASGQTKKYFEGRKKMIEFR